MAIQYKTRAFVFKKSDRNESDQTFSVFTDDFGKLNIFAKAIRKSTSKLRKDFDLFYLSEIEFIQGKSVKTLTDAVKIKKFDEIVLNRQKLSVANQIADTLDDFIKGQERDDNIFNLVEGCFNKLDDKSSSIKNYQLAFQYFFWNFISLRGYKIEVNSCAVCKKKLDPYNIYFSCREGGIICKNCLAVDKSARKINSDAAKILRLIFKKDWQTIIKLKVELLSENILKEILQDAVHAFCPVHC